jgi:hypothetical protein
MSDTDDTVMREIKRQTVALVFSVAGALITVYVMRRMHDPDFGRTAKMWAALQVKQLADKQVHWWQDIADRATFVYDQEKAW